jgi:SAM-dependent methyltransferase
MSHPFEHNGLAALSDLETPAWRSLFGSLLDEQGRFTAAESQFRTGDYKWPRRPLEQWSRVWEYPYVLHQLTRLRDACVQTGGAQPLVVDVGCGVTFFPFAVAHAGLRIVGTDLDPVCERELQRAAEVLPSSPGAVLGCRTTDGQTLPFSDGEADAVICVSVIEHIPTWERTLAELHRILKPGGLLVLTLDLDLLGNSEIGAAAHRRMMDQLEEGFTPVWSDRTIHPADLLTSDRGPYKLSAPPGLRGVQFHAKQLVKPLLGRQPVPPGGVRLAVHALTLHRR